MTKKAKVAYWFHYTASRFDDSQFLILASRGDQAAVSVEWHGMNGVFMAIYHVDRFSLLYVPYDDLNNDK